jgi:hypothetical protein
LVPGVLSKNKSEKKCSMEKFIKKKFPSGFSHLGFSDNLGPAFVNVNKCKPQNVRK